jgi:hypothetical protein
MVYGFRKPEPWAVRVFRRAAWRSALCTFVDVNDRVIGAVLLADELRRENRTAPKHDRNGR